MQPKSSDEPQEIDFFQIEIDEYQLKNQMNNIDNDA